MTSAPVDPAWPPGRWFSHIAGVFILQVLLILLLSDRAAELPRRPRNPFRVALLNAPDLHQRLASLPLAADPTLFALANLREFTGLAWQRPKASAPRLPPWRDPGPFPQTQVPSGLASLPGDFLRSQPIPQRSAFSRLPHPIGHLATHPPLLRTQSVVRLEGALSHRPLLAPLTAPPWPHPDLLTNTLVEVIVNTEGLVISTVSRQGSGSAGADRKALELARAARFRPSLHSTLEHGVLVVEWLTLPPPTPDP